MENATQARRGGGLGQFSPPGNFSDELARGQIQVKSGKMKKIIKFQQVSIKFLKRQGLPSPTHSSTPILKYVMFAINLNIAFQSFNAVGKPDKFYCFYNYQVTSNVNMNALEHLQRLIEQPIMNFLLQEIFERCGKCQIN